MSPDITPLIMSWMFATRLQASRAGRPDFYAEPVRGHYIRLLSPRSANRRGEPRPGVQTANPAWQGFDWEETVVKVNKKIFVLLGSADSPAWPAITVKLEDSNAAALGVPGAEATRYGLGKSGWVTVPLRRRLVSACSP